MTKGKFAVMLAPAWMLDYIKQQAPKTAGKWDVAAIPGGGGNQGGTQLSIPSSGNPANRQAAWDFIQWYLAPAQQLKVFKTYGFFPTTTTLYDDPALLNYKSEFFNNAPIGKIYAKGVSQLKPIFEGKKQRAIDSAFGNALARVAAGKQKAKAAWKKALAEIATAVGG
jgi:cellobiose transport system substrate-binding protein